MNTIASNPPRTWQYLLAIALPALVMIAALGVSTLQLHQKIDKIKEQQFGLENLPVLFDLTVTLQKIRSLTQLQRYGDDSVDNQRALQRSQLQEQMNRMKNGPLRTNPRLLEKINQLQRQIDNTLDAAEINTPHEIFLSHNALIRHSIDLIDVVAEESTLKYNSDPENSILVNLITHQLIELGESAGRVKGIGGGIMLNEQVGNRREFILAMFALRQSLNQVRHEAYVYLANTSQDELRLAHLMDQLFLTSDHFISQGELLLNGKRGVDDPITLSSEGSRVIDKVLLLFSATSELLSSRLTQRATRLRDMIQLTAFGGIVTVLLMSLFIFNFYRRNTRAFEELEELIALLYDSEAKNRAIINGAVDGIITINERGIIMNTNPAAEKLFGYSASEMMGNNINMLMPEPYQSNHDGYLRRYLGTATHRVIGIGREAVGMRKDGSCFPVALSVSEAPHQGKRIFTGTIHDISGRKAAERELNRHRHHLENIIEERSAELNALHDELRQFTNIATQDLMKQLLEIKQQIRWLAQYHMLHETDRDGEAEQPQRSTLREKTFSIDQICEQLLWKVNTMIKLSGAGLQKLNLETINMEVIAGSLKLSAKSQLEALQTHVQIGTLPTIYSDRRAVEQVLTRLFNNAISQLTHERSGMIEINSEEHDGCHFFYIRDNGRGISPDEIPQLFNPFAKQGSETVNHTELAYAQYLVRRLGGTLNCQSTLGEGSLFSFSLPVRSDQASTTETREENRRSLEDEHAIAG